VINVEFYNFYVELIIFKFKFKYLMKHIYIIANTGKYKMLQITENIIVIAKY